MEQGIFVRVFPCLQGYWGSFNWPRCCPPGIHRMTDVKQNTKYCKTTSLQTSHFFPHSNACSSSATLHNLSTAGSYYHYGPRLWTSAQSWSVLMWELLIFVLRWYWSNSSVIFEDAICSSRVSKSRRTICSRPWLWRLSWSTCSTWCPFSFVIFQRVVVSCFSNNFASLCTINLSSPSNLPMYHVIFQLDCRWMIWHWW
jgi:hypothetical protein